MKEASIFIVLLLLIGSIYGYEVNLFNDIDYFSDEYQKDYVDYNLYDLSGNPALMKLGYTKNQEIYQFSAGKKLNAYHRYFDNERTENMGMNLFWNKNLNRDITLATGVEYYHTYQINVERSLEKDFYEHYFSFSDTTNGDVVYQGPKLFMVYNQNINDNFLWGIQVNYGVERGLKDVYTECETIMRNSEISFGFGYKSNDKNTIIGLSGKYINRQSQYNSVKYYVNALNRTWIGFHSYFPEDPGTKVRKNDTREGYSFSMQFEKKQLLETNFSLRLSGNFGKHKNDIEVGYYSKPKPRGYWQREAIQLLANLYYESEIFNAQIYSVYKKVDDWAKPKIYEVIALENKEDIIRIGSIFDFKLNKKIVLNSGFEISSIMTDYYEYTALFEYEESRTNSYIQGGIQFAVDQISDIYFTGNYGVIEPDFKWEETDRFDAKGAKLGYTRQFIFGKIDFCLNYSASSPDNSDKTNEEFGIEIILQR